MPFAWFLKASMNTARSGQLSVLLPKRWVVPPRRSEPGYVTTTERQRLKELEREVRELRRSNDILRQASAYFAKAEFDRLWKK